MTFHVDRDQTDMGSLLAWQTESDNSRRSRGRLVRERKRRPWQPRNHVIGMPASDNDG
jgi:hypothetical protein